MLKLVCKANLFKKGIGNSYKVEKQNHPKIQLIITKSIPQVSQNHPEVIPNSP